MTRSLVIAPQWIGDAVMTEPLLRRLRARGESLTVGALPWVAPVYRAMPEVVDAVIELPFAHGGLQWKERRSLARALRGQFDVAYVCPNSFKSALLPWWAGIPKRVGYHGESRYGVLNQRLPNPPDGHRPPMVAFYSALSGETGTAQDRPQLQLDPIKVDAALAGMHLQRQGYYVFAPGAEYGPAKRWPARHFAVLAEQLNLPVVLLGSSKESALCAEITRTVNAAQPGQCLDWSGRTSLDHALAAISASKAMVSNDSGLMHVAAAFGLPQVALFGSSSPLHTPPLNPQAHVIWLKNDPGYVPALDCAPCFERECPLGHTRCLVDLTPDDVLHLVQP
ncbi:lipopolysaccharide heptosyltransferase II [Rhodoferax sp. AJA081-3]|uniref:lipopolysaccharide heptosyltransferase II n=1 Tax=Rhodoferax sp. AJA081-3 TaxID=2752316 RepID=UPI001ADF2933|nr:lipopolysaccharide heptosyltransferase II [Rhodoferax sp. AJA081-3]QTN26528.1 lipopolysaccharide heptosyltransferase II [Rhodoferax sp. AJA081-3]